MAVTGVSVEVLLRRSKTDQSGKGVKVRLSAAGLSGVPSESGEGLPGSSPGRGWGVVNPQLWVTFVEISASCSFHKMFESCGSGLHAVCFALLPHWSGHRGFLMWVGRRCCLSVLAVGSHGDFVPTFVRT